MGSGRPWKGGHQMQNKHERSLEEDQLQVGVRAALAVDGAAGLKVSPSQGPSVVAPSLFQQDAVLSEGPCCKLCEAPGLPPVQREEIGHQLLETQAS